MIAQSNSMKKVFVSLVCCFCVYAFCCSVLVSFGRINQLGSGFLVDYQDIEIANQNNTFGRLINLSLNKKQSEVGNPDEQSAEIVFKLFGIIPIKKVSVEMVDDAEYYVGGVPIGIEIDAKGAIVVGKSEGSQFNAGDIITQIDEKAITKIDKNNRQRVINALIFYESNHYSITENKTDKLLYDAIFIGLTTKRDNLYDIINKRVDVMIKDGLVEEAKSFYDKKILTKPLIGGIGYKELYQYFDEKISIEEAIELIKKNSRRYAKRQYTFFNHQIPVKWFETDYQNFNNTVENVCNYIDNDIKL